MALHPSKFFVLVGCGNRVVSITAEAYEQLLKDEEIEERTSDFGLGIICRELYDHANDEVIAFSC